MLVYNIFKNAAAPHLEEAYTDMVITCIKKSLSHTRNAYRVLPYSNRQKSSLNPGFTETHSFPLVLLCDVHSGLNHCSVNRMGVI